MTATTLRSRAHTPLAARGPETTSGEGCRNRALAGAHKEVEGWIEIEH